MITRFLTTLLLTMLLALPASATTEGPESFDDFLSRVREEASERGISAEIIAKALPASLTLDESALEKLRNQPESTFSFKKYYRHMVSDFRVSKGREKKTEHADLLARISQEYQVPAEVIVALWGVESAYGRLPGNSSIVGALATLAYGSHRKTFFRKELFNALEILQQGHILPEEMVGSWAGAMGQCQFMPSSFLNYAADGNGDGKKDIWGTRADVFASTANYLRRHGWSPGQPWQERVLLKKILPATLRISEKGLSEPKTTAQWRKMGVLPLRGVSYQGAKARLFLPEGPSGKAYLVYDNFGVIMRWNNASYFAFSVLSLAEELKGGRG